MFRLFHEKAAKTRYQQPSSVMLKMREVRKMPKLLWIFCILCISYVLSICLVALPQLSLMSHESMALHVRQFERDIGNNSTWDPPNLRIRPIDVPSAPYILLGRVIGNNLPPRHNPTQSLKNLKFILMHENLDNSRQSLRKVWVINHLVNSTYRNQVVHLLEQYKQEYVELAFNQSIYSTLRFEQRILKQPKQNLNPTDQKWSYIVEQAGVYDNKVKYVMNVNKARNFILSYGKKIGARWILPWDQNCYLTLEAFRELQRNLRSFESKGIKYSLTNMKRIVGPNEDLLSPKESVVNKTTEAVAEPMINFRNDSCEFFDEEMRYGRRDKVALLIRLGVPGVWTKWGYDTFEQRRTYHNLSTDFPPDQLGQAFTLDRVPVASWVARLNSGFSRLEARGNELMREVKRAEGIELFINSLDEDMLLQRHNFSSENHIFYQPKTMDKAQQYYHQYYYNRITSSEVKDKDYLFFKKVTQLGRDGNVIVKHCFSKNEAVFISKRKNVGKLSAERKHLFMLGEALSDLMYNISTIALATSISPSQEYLQCTEKLIRYFVLKDKELGAGSSDGSNRIAELLGAGRAPIFVFFTDAVRLISKRLDREVYESLKEVLVRILQSFHSENPTTFMTDTVDSILYRVHYDIAGLSLATFVNNPHLVLYHADSLQSDIQTHFDAEGEVTSFPPGFVTEKLQSIYKMRLAQAWTTASKLLSRIFSRPLDHEKQIALCRGLQTLIPCCSRELAHCPEYGSMAWLVSSQTYTVLARQLLETCPNLKQYSAHCFLMATTWEKLSSRKNDLSDNEYRVLTNDQTLEVARRKRIPPYFSLTFDTELESN